jgi:hypothetical protein
MTLNLNASAGVGTAPEHPITHIVIREFEPGTELPARTIRIPVKVFSIAATLVPGRVREELAKEGFDLDAILQAARDIHSPVTLVEVEDHEKRRKIVISLE